ncbi:MAG TPA: hypothetical protein VGC63_04720 [Solirubrobacterales bacterium]|jgi:hypothetical protein
MAGESQITLDGREVSMEEARRTSTAGGRLTQAQRLILDTINEKGQIRSVEAGVIVHLARGTKCAKGVGPSKLACYHYASTDGLSAMKRLAKRGLVRKVSVGIWA